MKRSLQAFAVIFCLSLPVFGEKKLNVSVLYFENTVRKADTAWLSKGLADMLISDLASSDELIIVEREELQKVIDEQDFSQSGFADNTEAVRLGKVLNAEKIVTGSYIVSGNDLRVDVKIINTTTAEIKSVSASGYLKDVSSIEKRLVTAVFKILEVKYPESITVDTNSYFALQNHYEGVDLLDHGKVQQALLKFEKAEEFDPLYDKPQYEKEKAFAFLKNFRKARFHRELSIMFREANEIIHRMEQDPFLQYSDVVNTVNMASMTGEEREAFNKKYHYYMIYTSPMHCAVGLQQKLMDIISKREEMFDDEWDSEEKRFDDELDSIRRKRRGESGILSEKDRKLASEYRSERQNIMKLDDMDEKNLKLDELKKDYDRDKEKLDSEIKSLNSFYDSREDAAEKAIDDFDVRREQAQKELDKKNRLLYDRIISIAEDAEKSLNKDPKFYPYVLYYRLLALNLTGDYKNLRGYCEYFMKTYPDAQMIWAVEDMYETALEKSE